MPFENYRDESIIWADPNATRLREKASLNNWKETATGQNIPRAQCSASLCPLACNGRCHIQVNVKNTEQELSSSGCSADPVPFLLMSRTCAVSFLCSRCDSPGRVTDSRSRCRKSLNFDGLQHQWINRTGKNRLRRRRNDAKSSEIIQWILIGKADCSSPPDTCKQLSILESAWIRITLKTLEWQHSLHFVLRALNTARWRNLHNLLQKPRLESYFNK